jgi:hypothetical protein
MAFPKGRLCAFGLAQPGWCVDPKLHHGALNAMFLPAVVCIGAGAESIRRERRLHRMALAMYLPLCDAHGNDIAEATNGMIEAVGLPRGLAGMGATPDMSERVIDSAMADDSTRSIRASPRARITGRCSSRRCGEQRVIATVDNSDTYCRYPCSRQGATLARIRRPPCYSNGGHRYRCRLCRRFREELCRSGTCNSLSRLNFFPAHRQVLCSARRCYAAKLSPDNTLGV